MVSFSINWSDSVSVYVLENAARPLLLLSIYTSLVLLNDRLLLLTVALQFREMKTTDVMIAMCARMAPRKQQ